MTRNEAQFIEAHARLRMNYHRSLTEAELPDEMLDLLDKYLKLSPAMIPPRLSDFADFHSPTLWHPDLHLDNVFVDPKSKKITHIIDWQSAAVLPLFYHGKVPAMFRHRGSDSVGMSTWPERPENFHDMESDERTLIDNQIGSQRLHMIYLERTRIHNPRHWAALQWHDERRIQPTSIIQSVWKNKDIFFLQRALMRIVSTWEELSPDSGPCPVSFSEEEMALYKHEEENRGYVCEVLTIFKDVGGLPPDGSIEAGRFEEVRGSW